MATPQTLPDGVVLDQPSADGVILDDAPEPPRGTPAWVDWRNHQATLQADQIAKAYQPNAAVSPWEDFKGGVGAAGLRPVAGGWSLLNKWFPGQITPPPDYWKEAATNPQSGYGLMGGITGDIGVNTAATLATGGGSFVGRVPVLANAARTSPWLLRAGKAAAGAVDSGLMAGGVEGLESGGDPGRTGTAAALAGALHGAGSLLTSKPAMDALTDLWGKYTGTNGEWLRLAATQASQKFRAALRGGIDEQGIVKDLNDAVDDLASTTSADYKAYLGRQNPNIRMSTGPAKNALLYAQKGYGMDPAGLTADEIFKHSPITNPGERAEMMGAMNDLANFSDFSPKGMDNLRQRMWNRAADAPGVKAYFAQIADAIKGEMGRNLGSDFTDSMERYGNARDLQHMLEKELGANAKNDGTTFTKLSQLFSRNNGFRKSLLEALDKETGSDLMNTMAGYSLRPWMARGLRGAVGYSGLGAAAQAAHSGDFWTALMEGGGAAAMSPRLAGELMSMLSTARRSGIGKFVGSVPIGKIIAPSVTNMVAGPSPALTPPPSR